MHHFSTAVLFPFQTAWRGVNLPDTSAFLILLFLLFIATPLYGHLYLAIYRRREVEGDRSRYFFFFLVFFAMDAVVEERWPVYP